MGRDCQSWHVDWRFSDSSFDSATRSELKEVVWIMQHY